MLAGDDEDCTMGQVNKAVKLAQVTAKFTDDKNEDGEEKGWLDTAKDMAEGAQIISQMMRMRRARNRKRTTRARNLVKKKKRARNLEKKKTKGRKKKKD